MGSSLYDISVGSYLQIVGAVSGFLVKSAVHFDDAGKDIETMVDARLYPDMAPMNFQLRSVVHHSLGAVRGIEAGVFTPPPSMPELDYGQLQSLVHEALVDLQGLKREDINACALKPLLFKVSGQEIPFTAENFVLSFSLPNLYFHAATAYDLLRIQGVPLGKMDFLGHMKIGV